MNNVIFQCGDYRNGVTMYEDGTLMVSDSDGHESASYELREEDKLSLIKALLK